VEISQNECFLQDFLLLGIISIILILSLRSYVNDLARTEIKEKMESLANEKFILLVNDEITENDSLILGLQNIRSKTSSRNTGSVEINVTIRKENDFTRLRLIRSNSFQSKYWVFYNNYKTTSTYCIGEINTNSLDKYR